MLSVALVSIGSGPLVVRPVQGHPDIAVIRIGTDFTLHVEAPDIDRLMAALAEARDVLQANAAVVAA
ncbi:hypothetical protein EV385_4392 [Krasilnikovia cinnamomea]|uniref:Uncharacterized protein n=1 Tax=Krasilnikovia cinnamomea TaxID=349313 RepID=A0A4V2G7G5_9ACTN|nr:hypothetical protein [Krasilnikovia cinnamomea]RZU52526.1 hypothetical protein EV385_4392 [Krasilnikovia cinnamomea]